METSQLQDGQIYGPYLPLTEVEIAQMYPGALSDFNRLVVQGTHQYRIRSEEFAKAGMTEEAQELGAYVEDRHSRLVRIASQAQ